MADGNHTHDDILTLCQHCGGCGAFSAESQRAPHINANTNEYITLCSLKSCTDSATLGVIRKLLRIQYRAGPLKESVEFGHVPVLSLVLRVLRAVASYLL